MLKLKSTQNEGVVMYGYDKDQSNMVTIATKILYGNHVYMGTRKQLLEKGEDFWKGLVYERNGNPPVYYNYKEKRYSLLIGFDAEFSGHSALELVKGEYIIIVKETPL